jgi:hypothetical protein
MKKVFLYTILMFAFCDVVLANDIKELNKKLLEIEDRIDECLETKDKKLCENIMIQNPIQIELMGNEHFARLLDSYLCKSGTKCGASMQRVVGKTLQVLMVYYQIE